MASELQRNEERVGKNTYNFKGEIKMDRSMKMKLVMILIYAIVFMMQLAILVLIVYANLMWDSGERKMMLNETGQLLNCSRTIPAYGADYG